MSDKEMMDWAIPFPPVLTKIACIPPIEIELSICKICQFCSQIQ